jgi:uncharacterized membrane protein YphA (DoxX/SURF4 family)
MFTELINNAIAVLLIRTVAGILFFFQGYDKLFNIRIINVARTFSEPLGKIHLPLFLLKPSITISSIIELVCGLLLFFGLFKNIALFLLAGDMIFVAFLFSCIKPMWDLQFYFPRLLFIFILLWINPAIDIFSLDYLISFKVK